jgi:hypothetical protein
MSNLPCAESFKLPPLPDCDQRTIKRKLHYFVDALSMNDALFLLALLEYSLREDETPLESVPVS